MHDPGDVSGISDAIGKLAEEKRKQKPPRSIVLSISNNTLNIIFWEGMRVSADNKILLKTTAEVPEFTLSLSADEMGWLMGHDVDVVKDPVVTQ